jgi:hypothetical protein
LGAEAPAGDPGVESEGVVEPFQGESGSDASAQGGDGRDGVAPKTARQNEAEGGEGAGSSGQRPGDLRTERFGEDPGLGDACLNEDIGGGAGVIVQGPIEGAWVGELGERT